MRFFKSNMSQNILSEREKKKKVCNVGVEALSSFFLYLTLINCPSFLFLSSLVPLLFFIIPLTSPPLSLFYPPPSEAIDPALVDNSLLRKLRSNRELGLSRLEEVITKYAVRQEDTEEQERAKRLGKSSKEKEV